VPQLTGPPLTLPPLRRGGGQRRLGPRIIARDGRCGRRWEGASGAAVRAGDIEADGRHHGDVGSPHTPARGGEWGCSPHRRGGRSRDGGVGCCRSRTDARAGGMCRACAAAAVVTPMTAGVRPSAAPSGRPAALSSRTMGGERLLEQSNRMWLGCPVECHRRTEPQNTVHASDQIDFSGGLNASTSF